MNTICSGESQIEEDKDKKLLVGLYSCSKVLPSV